MPIWIDPRGQPTFGIGICDRCRRKLPLAELMPDPNSPGLRVCEMDKDDFDPYRLPARITEKINLPFVRPDVGMDPPRVPVVDPDIYALLTNGFEPILTEDGEPLLWMEA